MARRKSLVDDLVLLPWWVSAGLALAVFLVLSATLPPSMAGLALMIPFFLMLIAGISALRAWKTARMLDQQTGIDSIRELSWKRFEDLLGEAYRRQGYKVEETLGGGADGGVDLVLGRNGDVTLVQCKRWRGKPVPVQTVRELFGVLHDRGAASAKLVATSRFTPEAIAFAKGKPIELVDSDAILHLLRGVQASGRIVSPNPSRERDNASDAAPPCPSGQWTHGQAHRTSARESRIKVLGLLRISTLPRDAVDLTKCESSWRPSSRRSHLDKRFPGRRRDPPTSRSRRTSAVAEALA